MVMARGGLDFIQAEHIFRSPSEAMSLCGPCVREHVRAFDNPRPISLIEVAGRRPDKKASKWLSPFARQAGDFERSREPAMVRYERRERFAFRNPLTSVAIKTLFRFPPRPRRTAGDVNIGRTLIEGTASVAIDLQLG